MYELFKQTTSIERLQSDEERITIDPKNSYLKSYPEFLTYFSKIEKLEKHNVIIGIGFTYSWMPTIFDYRSTNIDEDLNSVTEILNKIKQGYIPIKSDLDFLKRCFNNSLVGTSKLLHFINPKDFAIWDSRVYRYLTNTQPHSYRLENSSAYLEYLKFCKDMTEDERYDNIYKSILSKIGYDISKLRSIELIMFSNGLSRPYPLLPNK